MIVLSRLAYLHRTLRRAQSVPIGRPFGLERLRLRSRPRTSALASRRHSSPHLPDSSTPVQSNSYWQSIVARRSPRKNGIDKRIPRHTRLAISFTKGTSYLSPLCGPPTVATLLQLHCECHCSIMAFDDRLPPGTQRLEDQAGSKILLAPQPNADPNQPLVCIGSQTCR
jgi:hypothetical protein